MKREKIPEKLLTTLDRISERLKHDERICGLSVGGSYLKGDMDEYSDIDLVVFAYANYYEEILKDRENIAEELGVLLQCFTGEHVGEPRLLICLYDNPLVHVDLKFIKPEDYVERVEDSEIIWEKEGMVSLFASKSSGTFPYPDYQWIEDRFWIWLHYVSLKLGRGELFEAIEFISFLRMNVIGPLILIDNGELPRGVRKLEQYAGEYLTELEKTVCPYDYKCCFQAVEKIVEIYRKLRVKLFDDKVVLNKIVEKKSLDYFEAVRTKKSSHDKI